MRRDRKVMVDSFRRLRNPQAATPAIESQCAPVGQRAMRALSGCVKLRPGKHHKGIRVFKNMIVYRIAPPWQMGLEADRDGTAEGAVPGMRRHAGAVQRLRCRAAMRTACWPRAWRQWCCAMTEAKMLPASVLARKVKESRAHSSRKPAAKPGKKESRELKDEAKLDLLPMAFTKQARCGCGSTRRPAGWCWTPAARAAPTRW